MEIDKYTLLILLFDFRLVSLGMVCVDLCGLCPPSQRHRLCLWDGDTRRAPSMMCWSCLAEETVAWGEGGFFMPLTFLFSRNEGFNLWATQLKQYNFWLVRLVSGRCPIRISAGTQTILIDGFLGFSQSVQACSRIVPYIRPWPLSFVSFQIHYLLMIRCHMISVTLLNKLQLVSQEICIHVWLGNELQTFWMRNQCLLTPRPPCLLSIHFVYSIHFCL
jgi:hypothetical protein